MSDSYTPAAKLLGRRIRITYAAVLLLLFVARMWGVHGVYDFFGLDAGHGEIASIAGRLPGQSTEVTHAAFLQAYAPSAASNDTLDRAIGTRPGSKPGSERPSAVCPGGVAAVHPLSRALEAQMLAVAASAR